MNKDLIYFGIVLFISLVACSEDDDSNGNGAGPGNGQQTSVPTIDDLKGTWSAYRAKDAEGRNAELNSSIGIPDTTTIAGCTLNNRAVSYDQFTVKFSKDSTVILIDQYRFFTLSYFVEDLASCNIRYTNSRIDEINDTLIGFYEIASKDQIELFELNFFGDKELVGTLNYSLQDDILKIDHFHTLSLRK